MIELGQADGRARLALALQQGSGRCQIAEIDGNKAKSGVALQLLRTIADLTFNAFFGVDLAASNLKCNTRPRLQCQWIVA